MKIFGRDLSRETALVAELGVNHEGDPRAALRLLRLAVEAGADAVKLQSYTAARLVSADDPERRNRVERFALHRDAHLLLASEAKALDASLFSTAVTEDWVPLLADLFPAIKIASGDLTFEPVIRAAAGTGKPIILSTGVGRVDEIEQAVAWIREEIDGIPLDERLVLMHCISAYPAPIEQANLRSIPFLSEHFGVSVGYSNHVIGSGACLTAAALGAAMIEVHFTDRKSGRDFRDHQLSMEPDEFRRMAEAVRLVRRSLGSYEKHPQPCEAGIAESIRKGVVAARDLSAGTILRREDLMFARPATGFPASRVDEVVGRSLQRGVAEGEIIVPRDLCE